jgi:hypothetical protein
MMLYIVPKSYCPRQIVLSKELDARPAGGEELVGFHALF